MAAILARYEQPPHKINCMSNLQNISLKDFIIAVSQAAPIVLTTCALLSFVAMGIFCYDYYAELFTPRFGSSGTAMAILAASIQELVRFGLLIASIRDFSEGKKFNGWLGLIGSVALVWHDIVLSKNIAMAWSETNASAYESILWFLIIIGLLLELRLVLTVSSSDISSNRSTESINANSQTSKKASVQGTV